MIHLTDEERIKFAAWLEEDAASYREILVQLEKLGEHGQIIAKQHKIEMAAELLIARKLRSIESVTIESK